MDAAQVDGLWLSYRDKRLRPPSLKLAIATRRQRARADRWALRDVSFSIEQGEMLGIIGSNGSGKSTLLRCLAGIFRPVKGSVTVRGRTSSLIDLTAGFHRLLSARDNIYLSGAIYGIPRRAMRDRMDEILGFAELEDAADMPLRAFSTGMAMRLGFSVAVALDPDTLLVDEVLAVGDEAFKVKCFDRVADLRAKGTTIVFVSHELAVIRSLCDRVLVMDDGSVLTQGQPEDAVRTYCDHLGVDLDFALSRPMIEPAGLERLETEWKPKRKRSG